MLLRVSNAIMTSGIGNSSHLHAKPAAAQHYLLLVRLPAPALIQQRCPFRQGKKRQPRDFENLRVIALCNAVDSWAISAGAAEWVGAQEMDNVSSNWPEKGMYCLSRSRDSSVATTTFLEHQTNLKQMTDTRNDHFALLQYLLIHRCAIKTAFNCPCLDRQKSCPCLVGVDILHGRSNKFYL